jgi:hypothetical protein
MSSEVVPSEIRKGEVAVGKEGKKKDHWAHMKGGRPKKITPVLVVEAFQEFLRMNYTYGGPGTDGTPTSNFISYMITEHEVFSICATHDLDRFDRIWRCAYFIALSVYQLAWSSVISGQTEPILSIVMVSLMVEPIKMLVRAGIECPCVWSHEPCYRVLCCCIRCSKDLSDLCVRLGSAMAAFVIVFCILFGIMAFFLIRPDQEEDNFFLNWMTSILISTFFTTPLFVYIGVRMNYNKDRARFVEKWGPFFPSDKPPLSFSDLAIEAAKNGFPSTEATRLYKPQWKGWFLKAPMLMRCCGVVAWSASVLPLPSVLPADEDKQVMDRDAEEEA